MKSGLKRALRILGLVFLSLVLLIAGTIGAAFIGNSPVEDGREVARGVRIVKDGYVSLAMIDIGGGKVALVDAGNDPAGAAILAELGRRKLGPEAVAAVLLTHGHRDHLAACHLFSNAEIYALAAEVDLAEGRVASPSPVGHLVGKQPGVKKVTRALADGETLTLGDRTVRVFAIPGHTAGSAAYLVDGALFLGDSAGASSDGKVKAAPFFFSDSTARNRASIHALAERLRPMESEVKVLVPAHTGTLAGLGPLLAFVP